MAKTNSDRTFGTQEQVFDACLKAGNAELYAMCDQMHSVLDAVAADKPLRTIRANLRESLILAVWSSTLDDRIYPGRDDAFLRHRSCARARKGYR